MFDPPDCACRAKSAIDFDVMPATHTDLMACSGTVTE
jgi:hypothetical protein